MPWPVKTRIHGIDRVDQRIAGKRESEAKLAAQTD